MYTRDKLTETPFQMRSEMRENGIFRTVSEIQREPRKAACCENPGRCQGPNRVQCNWQIGLLARVRHEGNQGRSWQFMRTEKVFNLDVIFIKFLAQSFMSGM